MAFEVKIVADSISQWNRRLTTMQLRYPRFIHAEFMTHRVFSRNASSSRAIPVAKMIEQVRSGPAMPIHWGKNQTGMQAREELDPVTRTFVITEWHRAAIAAASFAEKMSASYGVHKQVVNRILEPFQWMNTIVTATEWDNFYSLRCHPDAQPEIQRLAEMMREAQDRSIPVLLQSGEWHLPYVLPGELGALGPIQTHLRGGIDAMGAWTDDMMWALARKISTARCARVSYLKHDQTKASIEEELALYDRLVGSVPIHASPTEHQATPDEVIDTCGPLDDPAPYYKNFQYHGNFVGWVQHRKIIELGPYK